MPERLTRSFFRQDPVTVARGLLGRRLVRVLDGQRLAGVIVETEAYLGAEDRAAHTYRGRRTARNNSMFLDGGHAYVYFTYGMHYCLNAVAGRVNDPVAVLIRALEPVEGLEAMRRRRRVERDTQLCSGPAKLSEALAIDRGLDGTDLVTGDALFIEAITGRRVGESDIAVGPRVGVAYAGEWAAKPLRFCLRDNPHVSR